jgi:hypothetical protein
MAAVTDGEKEKVGLSRRRMRRLLVLAVALGAMATTPAASASAMFDPQRHTEQVNATCGLYPIDGPYDTLGARQDAWSKCSANIPWDFPDPAPAPAPTPAPPATPVSPPNRAQIKRAEPPKLNWSLNSAFGAQRVEWSRTPDLRADGAFVAPAGTTYSYDLKDYGQGATSSELPWNLKDGTYYWHVQTMLPCCVPDGVAGPWGPTASFTYKHVKPKRTKRKHKRLTPAQRRVKAENESASTAVKTEMAYTYGRKYYDASAECRHTSATRFRCSVYGLDSGRWGPATEFYEGYAVVVKYGSRYSVTTLRIAW